MKFIHLSDLHLGKRVNEYSMLEDQEYILKKIINIVDAEKPDGVIIAGDVYDKSVPAAEAVQLFDNFLVQLAKRKLEVFVISGNHDSPERIAFGSRIMDASGIHMSPVYNGKIVPFSMQDEYGTVDVCKYQNTNGFTCSVRQYNSTTDLLLSVTSITTCTDVKLDGLVKLCCSVFFYKFDCICTLILNCSVDFFRSIDISFSSFHEL